MRKTITFVLIGLFIIGIGSEDLTALERQGKQIYVHFKNGESIKGELIGVKPDYLLVLDSTAGVTEGIDIKDVRFIDIEKKPQILLGILVGSIPGMCIGYALGGPYEDIDWPWGGTTHAESQKAMAIAAGAVLGGLIDGMIGGFAFSKDERFKLEGMSEREVQFVLEKLRKIARVPDYK